MEALEAILVKQSARNMWLQGGLLRKDAVQSFFLDLLTMVMVFRREETHMNTGGCQ